MPGTFNAIRGWTANSIAPDIDLHNQSLAAVDHHFSDQGAWGGGQAQQPKPVISPIIPSIMQNAVKPPTVSLAIPALQPGPVPPVVSATQLFQDRVKQQQAIQPPQDTNSVMPLNPLQIDTKLKQTSQPNGWGGLLQPGSSPALPNY